MYKLLRKKLLALYLKQVPATGIGLFRILFGLVTLQEIFFLIFFNHLIFDPIPFLDVEFPMIVPFLWIWAFVALALTVGYRCQPVSIANYLFWLVFVNFTPMQRDFDGGFDLFMIGSNFFLMFMPIDKALGLDNLRKKLATPFVHNSHYIKPTVSVLAYYLPVVICLGFLYLDSAIHKMFAEHWRNGLGAWLPSSLPYYISAIDFSWWLNQEILQKIIGYTIIVFQFGFLWLYHQRRLRPLVFLIGIALHLGITLSLNIYPFGMGMLIFYSLIMPFSWCKCIIAYFSPNKPVLKVFFNQQCPLSCRKVLILNHFDILNCLDFKAIQVYAKQHPGLDTIKESELLGNLYALDEKGRIYAGVHAYAQILIAMRYMAGFGWLLKIPGISHFANRLYRNNANNRATVKSGTYSEEVDSFHFPKTWYDRIFVCENPAQARISAYKISKVVLVLLVLQINSTLQFGLLYRLHINTRQTLITSTLTDMSNALLLFSTSFLGITPHALYLHDHFQGYDHILAITYVDKAGEEQWLPFVNSQGRLLAPNWGRVHSMWANIAVTPNIDETRLKKFIMKITAFWGIQQGLNLQDTQFIIKMKYCSSPFVWEKNLRNKNLSGLWQSIGTVRWQGKEATISLPEDIDIL